MKEQLYGRKGKLYFWSPQDGEVCVNLKQETPSLITLWDCETDQPLKGFRRGSKMWDKIQAVIEPPKSGWGRLKRAVKAQIGAGPVEAIYKRGGQSFYWNITDGEQLAKLQQDGAGIHVLIGEGLRERTKKSFLIEDRKSLLWRQAVATGLIRSKKTDYVGGGGGGDVGFVGAINPRKRSSKTSKKHGRSKQKVNVRNLVANALR